MASAPKPLHTKDQAALVKRYPHWKVATDFSKATRTIAFKKHVDAIVFIARLGIYAEVHGHHPELTLTRANIKLVTSTHKQLTALDVALIKHVEVLLKGGDNEATSTK